MYGPNGFYRLFAGSDKNPAIRIRCDYESKKTNGLTGCLLLHFENKGKTDQELLLEDLSYGQKSKVVHLQAGASKTIVWDTNKQYQWYDVQVRCKGCAGFSEQFAGRVEIGAHSKTDPQMA